MRFGESMKILIKLLVEVLVILAFSSMLAYSTLHNGELYSFRGEPASLDSSPIKYVFNFIIHLLVIIAFSVSGWFSYRKFRRNRARRLRLRKIN